MAVEFVLFGSALLMIAAWCDVATRTIPDTLSLLLLASGGLTRVLEGPSALALSVGTALLLFALLLIAFSRGLIGGGDVKLMTAFTIGISPLDSYRFVVATAIVGGLLAITYLLLSRMPHFVGQIRRTSLLGRVFTIEAWRIRRHGPLPYGVAIAAGGTFVLLHSGSF
jgi:prepilin peptidase CpaA